MKNKQERGRNALLYCFMTALSKGSVVPVQARKCVTAVIHPFPGVTMTVCHSLQKAQGSIPSPLLWGKRTFLNQLLFLGSGPITLVCGPDTPPAPLYIHIHPSDVLTRKSHCIWFSAATPQLRR